VNRDYSPRAPRRGSMPNLRAIKANVLDHI